MTLAHQLLGFFVGLFLPWLLDAFKVVCRTVGHTFARWESCLLLRLAFAWVSSVLPWLDLILWNGLLGFFTFLFCSLDSVSFCLGSSSVARLDHMAIVAGIES